jgi:hypothetical protein
MTGCSGGDPTVDSSGWLGKREQPFHVLDVRTVCLVCARIHQFLIVGKGMIGEGIVEIQKSSWVE